VIPVGTGTTASGDGTTYSGLLSDIADHLNREDLNTKIPGFIRRVEERLNRILRVPEMEDTVTLTADAERIDLPVDFRKARALYLDTDPRQELEPVSLGTLRTKYAVQITGKPEVYAISGSEIVFGPAPDATYDALLTYFQEIPPLSAESETNWLVTAHYSIYLYGALCMAEAYIWDDERLPLWKAAWDEALDELMEQGKGKQYGGAPLRLRASVRE